MVASPMIGLVEGEGTLLEGELVVPLGLVVAAIFDPSSLP